MCSNEGLYSFLGEKSAGPAEIVEEVGIIGAFDQGGAETRDCLLIESSLKLSNSQSFQRANAFQVWNGFAGVPLCQQSVTKLQVRAIKFWIQLQRALERSDRGGVVSGLRINLSKVEKSLGKIWSCFRGLAKFGDCQVKASLLVSFNTRLHVLSGFGRNALQRKREK